MIGRKVVPYSSSGKNNQIYQFTDNTIVYSYGLNTRIAIFEN